MSGNRTYGAGRKGTKLYAKTWTGLPKCPTCRADAGEPCYDMNVVDTSEPGLVVLNTGWPWWVKRPHRERLGAATIQQAMPLMSRMVADAQRAGE